jgi:PII-like signaling protein
MQLLEEGYLLRIFIGEADKYQGKPLYEWLVVQAKQQGLAGATALRGIMGFGANSRKIQTFKLTRLSEDMPVVVEIVDTKDRLEAYLETIDVSIQAGMVTMEKAIVRFYRGNGKK